MTADPVNTKPEEAAKPSLQAPEGKTPEKPKSADEQHKIADVVKPILESGAEPQRQPFYSFVKNYYHAGRDIHSTEGSWLKSSTDLHTGYDVSNELVRTASAVFEPEKVLGQVVSRLRSNRLAVIHGAPDRGAKPLSYVALRRTTGDERRIIELPQATALRALREISFEQGCAYSVEVSGGVSGIEYDRPALESQLKSTGAYLVVRRRGGYPAESDLTCESWMGWVIRPDLILQRLLSYRVGTGKGSDQVDRLLAEARSVLEELAAYDSIDHLVMGLVAVARGEEEYAQIIERMPGSAEKTLLEWFSKHETPELRCYLITSAVFDGLPWSMAVDAAQDLRRRLTVETDSSPGKAHRGFGLRRDEIADRIEASIERVPLKFGGVTTQADGLRLRNLGWRDRAFEVSAAYFVDARETLFSWLRELGLRDDGSLSMNLGNTVAHMMQRDFSDALRNILRLWAEAGSEGPGMAVASAFDRYSKLGGSANLAMSVLANWLHAPPRHPLVVAALNVLAHGWGWMNHTHALDLLKIRTQQGGLEELHFIVLVIARIVTNSESPANRLIEVVASCLAWRDGTPAKPSEQIHSDDIGETISLLLVILLSPSSLFDFMEEKTELLGTINRILATAARRPQGDPLKEAALNRLVEFAEAAYPSSRYRKIMRRFVSIFGLADNQAARDRQRFAQHLRGRMNGKPSAKFAEELGEQLRQTPAILEADHVRS